MACLRCHINYSLRACTEDIPSITWGVWVIQHAAALASPKSERLVLKVYLNEIIQPDHKSACYFYGVEVSDLRNICLHKQIGERQEVQLLLGPMRKAHLCKYQADFRMI